MTPENSSASASVAVSVLMPSFNYARWLPEALASVMAQTFRDFELLAVDDGSRDGSVEILESWRARFPGKIRLLTHPGRANQGLAASYRLALAHARGEFTAFLEADDAWEPENLEKKIRALRDFPAVSAVYSGYRPFGHARGAFFWNTYRWLTAAETPRRRPFSALPFLLRRNPVATFSNFVTRRRLLAEIPEAAPRELFYDWWTLAHLAPRGAFFFLPEPLVRWRIHEKSANFGPFTQSTFQALQQFLSRLYDSLEREPAADKAGLARGRARLRAYAALAERKGLLRHAGGILREPLHALRFLGHIGLKNLLIK
ncbi:MAG TPA: glycosyltransferase [Verrucomicrobiae bacterium]|nr:glycosyltransferase [Verrucomicrobiae bacterium]